MRFGYMERTNQLSHREFCGLVRSRWSSKPVIFVIFVITAGK